MISTGSLLARELCHAFYVVKLKLPVTLLISPMTLVCPLCRAKPGRDCATVSGIPLPIVHVSRIRAARITAAAIKDATATKRRAK